MNVNPVEPGRPVVKEAPTAPDITGAELTRRLRGKSPAQRAAFAYRVIAGDVTLCRLTHRQASRVCGVDRGSVGLAMRATIADRTMLYYGKLTIRELRRQQTGDDEIDRFVNEVGAARVLQALDRATAPQVSLAAE